MILNLLDILPLVLAGAAVFIAARIVHLDRTRREAIKQGGYLQGLMDAHTIASRNEDWWTARQINKLAQDGGLIYFGEPE